MKQHQHTGNIWWMRVVNTTPFFKVHKCSFCGKCFETKLKPAKVAK